MSRFPFPLGGGAFGSTTRYERAILAVKRLMGEGGYPDDDATLVQRTYAIFGRLAGALSLSTDRFLEQIFPNTSHDDGILADHEAHLRAVRDPLAGVEERRAALADTMSDPGGAGFVQIADWLERVVGAGNVAFKFNTAAALDAGGFPRVGVFAVAFEVPVAFIRTVGQWRKLKEIVLRRKSVHVGIAVTRSVNRGFLADDQQSLTDRDVVRA